MKRDMDLIRAILLQVEARPPLGSEVPEFELEGWPWELVLSHVRLLHDAGYVVALFDTGPAGPGAAIQEMTWAGHDLLDSIRDSGVWAAVKSKIAEVGGSVPLELLKPLAMQYLRGKLGLPHG